MDEAPQGLNGQLGPQGGAVGSTGKQNLDESPRLQYSIPGILHFIQHEWSRFEMERAHWEVEKAELNARIAFLQGERKGQENLKNDLVRRIKMLEYALKQERAKFHKLKYGVDLPGGTKPPPEESIAGDGFSEDFLLSTNNLNVSWRQGRNLLRQYLQEIGYSDTIVDVRSSQVRALLGLNSGSGARKGESAINGGDSLGKGGPGDASTQRKGPGKKGTSLTEGLVLDAEASVMANMEFLSGEDGSGGGGLEEEEEDSDEEEERGGMTGGRKNDDGEQDSALGELALAIGEFSFLSETDGGGHHRGGRGVVSALSAPGSRRPLLGNEVEDLGDLATLSINNESENTYEMSGSKEAFRKIWNAKYTLRSHFDGVRAVGFLPVEPGLITASEDHTLKLWNLQKTVPTKKSASLDVEPVYTFRGHRGPVLSLVVAPSGEECYSGGVDGTIRCWNIPSSEIDPYDTFDPSVLSTTFEGHRDAVWGLSIHPFKSQVLSCSADGSVKLWQQGPNPCLSTFTVEAEQGPPTTVDFIRCETSPVQFAVGHISGLCVIYDLETGKPLTRIVTSNESKAQINRVVSHPTLNILLTAHEDHQIRFWDISSGLLLYSMVAHLDAVTSLAIDPNALYLVSGSHDSSIRLWNLEDKTCVQEITSHRKKFDESILDVAFHPTKPYIASTGADGMAKVFV
ncbi:unnamed protein product [Cyprideis torosa]|uniref:Uncharacterized protein n=1 Tax=Cyprideis torosa TaxID=163714 RepID=A0A7R8W141_9CRUS|nr:unnamed protein product [Cyprideis torosa]CAG0880479.1 unnamed protein product [Cyprideis torosa]